MLEKNPAGRPCLTSELKMPHDQTFTRQALTEVLTDAGRPDLAEMFHSRLLEHGDAGAPGTCLALTYDRVTDLAAFLMILGTAPYVPVSLARAFAEATQPGLPSHPDFPGACEAYWPGWRLLEPSIEEWWDLVNDCYACGADVDGRCGLHETPPWAQTEASHG